jgi:CRISPR system Cascade subunit CasD
MQEYLVLQLYGPLVSWGEIAVGEIRHTANHPSKSALIGLLGAALGINRDQELEQKNLSISYEFAIQLLSSGSLLNDYHTTQTVSSMKNRCFHSRREALMSNKKQEKTILSKREYRCDALAIVAIRANETPFYPLSSVREALLRPKYHLYLGRKSCPLALPLSPILIQAKGPKNALDQYPPADALKFLYRRFKFNKENMSGYYWEGEASDLNPSHTVIRHDQPGSRKRWQFGSRNEHVMMED